MSRLHAVALLLFTAGCLNFPVDGRYAGEGEDAGLALVEPRDAGALGGNAGDDDAGTPDAGVVDAGTDDAGSDDAGSDAGPVDAGQPIDVAAFPLASIPLVAAPMPVTLALPDYVGALQADAGAGPSWARDVVNAVFGCYDNSCYAHLDAWLSQNWLLIEYYDRANRYSAAGWLTHRGIPYSVDGSNEINNSLHLDSSAQTAALFGDNGFSQDVTGAPVLSDEFVGNSTFAGVRLTTANAPRWWATLNHEWTASPLLGDAISQDNIGTPTVNGAVRVDPDSPEPARFSRFDDLKFAHYLSTAGRSQLDGGDVRAYLATRPALRALFDDHTAAAGATAAADPVLADYQLFQHVSHLYNLSRLRRDNRLVAARAGREYSVHGNQSGLATPGHIVYEVASTDLLDAVWIEHPATSEFDLFRTNPATGQVPYASGRGPLRIALSMAAARGRKPVLHLDGFIGMTPGAVPLPLLEHNWAEACAGGPVLFSDYHALAANPPASQALTTYFSFRESNRALFEWGTRSSMAQVALVYSAPTLLYSQFFPFGSLGEAPVNDLHHTAISLEQAHVPWDVVIAEHPDLTGERLTLAGLQRYAVLILPSMWNLSDAHLALLVQYAASGGNIVVLGDLGLRDEYNRPRAALSSRAGVGPNVILPTALANQSTVRTLAQVMAPSVPANQVLKTFWSGWWAWLSDTQADAQRRAFTDGVAALSASPIDVMTREATPRSPRKLFVKLWQHPGDIVAAHFVNYDVTHNFPTRAVTITDAPASTVRLRLPPAMRSAVPATLLVSWLRPGANPLTLAAVAAPNGMISVDVPAVQLYGVLTVSLVNSVQTASRLARGDSLIRRLRRSGAQLSDLEARVARVVAVRSNPASFVATAELELRNAAIAADAAAVTARNDAPLVTSATRAFDFGETTSSAPWVAVPSMAPYSPDAGFGWIERADTALPTPERSVYRFRCAEEGRGQTVQQFWPYAAMTQPKRSGVFSGNQQHFRVDLPDGWYRVWLASSRSSYCNDYHRVSGLAVANGATVLADVPLDVGDVVEREFFTQVTAGSLELRFGGATGFGVAAMALFPAAAPVVEPIERGGVRQWLVSPRYRNPDGFPLDETRAPPEQLLEEPTRWVTGRVVAAPTGLPVVDLGANRPGEGDQGDTVYAVAVLPRTSAGVERLSISSTSAARVWLNGVEVLELPNQLGLMKDEATAPLALRAGDNVLVVKLQRFWEAHWLFYASVVSP